MFRTYSRGRALFKAARGCGSLFGVFASPLDCLFADLQRRFTLLAAASCSTFASNASDWQRNARKKNDPVLGQLFGFPLANVRYVFRKT